jgi:hypothetical protein
VAELWAEAWEEGTDRKEGKQARTTLLLPCSLAEGRPRMRQEVRACTGRTASPSWDIYSCLKHSLSSSLSQALALPGGNEGIGTIFVMDCG